jgi:SulP family sulfate permease
LPETHGPTLTLGLISIALILVLKRLHKRIPAALVTVVLGIAVVALFNLEPRGVQVLGEIPKGLPALQLPVIPWNRLGELFPMALTLALIAFMEAVSIAKAVEEKEKTDELRSNQELRALGFSNIVGAFFQAYPSTGSFSRTAINQQAGAKTGLSLIISALVIGLTLLFLTDLFDQLPNAILAAIILVAVLRLIDLRYPVILYKKRKDEFVLLIITFLLTLFIGIKEGILLGVLFSLLLLVHRTSKPHIAVLGKIKGSPYFRNLKRFEKEAETTPGLLIFRFDGQLYFGNRDYFKKQLMRLIEVSPTPVQTVILNAEAMNYIDSSAVYTLRQVLDDFDQRGITLLVAGAIGPTRDILHKSGLIHQLGKEGVFSSTLDAYEYALNNKAPSALQQKISLQSKEH